MHPSGVALKAAILAATMVAMPTNAETSIPFHHGVNLSVSPGGANSSSVPLATQKAENEQRVAEAAILASISSDCAWPSLLDGHRVEVRPREDADPCQWDNRAGALAGNAGRRGDDGGLAPNRHGSRLDLRRRALHGR